MSADALAPIVDKIRPLIRMLSSDQSGEIVAAARALVRLLKSVGADVHTLADGIGSDKLSQADMKKIYDAGHCAGFEAGVRSVEDKLCGADFHDIGDEDLAEMARRCAMHAERLRNDRERSFVRSMVQQTARGRKLTGKQAGWLRDIASRVRR